MGGDRSSTTNLLGFGSLASPIVDDNSPSRRKSATRGLYKTASAKDSKGSAGGPSPADGGAGGFRYSFKDADEARDVSKFLANTSLSGAVVASTEMAGVV